METLFANREARTVKGLLLPWGELSRMASDGKGGGVQPIYFQRGDVAVPADPSIVGANVAHNREDPRGRAVALDDTADGIVATFAIARTPEGDTLMDDIESGKLSRLSPEIRGIHRDPADAKRGLSGFLFGAAFVTEGAFASASLYGELLAEESESHSTEEYTDENGVTWVRKYDTTTTTDQADNTTTRTTVTTVTEEQKTEAEAKEPTNQEETTMPPAETQMAASVPQTMLAGALSPAGPAGSATPYVVACALAGYFSTGDTSGIQSLAAVDRAAGELMFAALNDVKVGGVGANIIQPQWIGDVWGARTRVRKFTPLIGNAALAAFQIKGFKFDTKPAGAAWAGDKAAVPTNTPTTVPVTANASRWAGGHDIAREFVDFSVPEFWLSYFAYMTNDYTAWSDNLCRDALIAGATAVVRGALTGDVNPATALLVDGALAVIATEEATPSFALVGTDVYRTLLLQKKDDIIATLSLSLGLETGDLAGFRIVPSSVATLTGKALVGSHDAATFYELPGAAPIRTEALDMVKGGVDHAFFGYAATMVNNAAALALVSAPAGP